MDLKALFDRIVEAALPETVEINGRTMIRANAYQEVRANEKRLRVVPTFGSVADFADAVREWAKEHVLEDAKPAVWVNASGCGAVLNPICREDDREDALMGVYTAALPPEGNMSHDDFLGLLDRYGEAIGEADALRAVLRVLTVQTGHTAKYEDVGVATNVTVEATAGKVVNTSIPKVLTFAIPYGDPSYQMDLSYRLQVKTAGGEPIFRLVAMPQIDQRDEKFVVRAMADLRTAFGGDTPAGVRVYRAANPSDAVPRFLR